MIGPLLAVALSVVNVQLGRGDTFLFVRSVPAQVPAGRVTFVVRNVDPREAHEFVVLKTTLPPGGLPITPRFTAREPGLQGRIPIFRSGQTRRLTLTLKPGRYVLLCNLMAHYKVGRQFSGFRVGG